MYDIFTVMVIDENKEKSDISDHNFVCAYFNLDYYTHKKYNITKERSYWKINEETKRNYLKELEEDITKKNISDDLTTVETLIKKAFYSNIKKNKATSETGRNWWYGTRVDDKGNKERNQ